jgi:hypothetical protein
MSNVFYLRHIEPPIVPDDVQAMAAQALGCFNLHRVDWRQSFLAADGARMLCWYVAPDAESARVALRQLGADMSAVWPGTLIADAAASPLSAVGIVAEVRLDEPLTRDALVQRTRALESHGEGLVAGFVSNRGTKLVYMLAGSDVEAAARGLDDAGFSAETLWRCIPITPKAH